MSGEEDIKLCDIIGSVGKYQISLLIINILTSALFSMYNQTVGLLAPEVSMYWNWEASNPNKTLFKSTDCKMTDIMEHNRTSNISGPSAKLIYECQYSRQTLTEKLNLVCERSWLVSLANYTLLLGVVLGSTILGRLSEIYGRRLSVIYTAFVDVLSCICILFTEGYVMLLLALFIFGATSSTVSVFVYIEVLEVFPKTRSQFVGAIAKSGIVFGQTLFVGVAWIIEDWFYIQVFQTVYVAAVFFLLMYTLESPMWLAVRHRYKDAKYTLATIVNRNGLKRESLEHKIDTYLEQIKARCEIQRKSEKGMYSDLFKNRVITFYTCALCMTRVSMLVIYQGLMMNAESFGSGLYWDLTISNAVSFGSVFVSLVVMKIISVRQQMIVCYVCLAIVCIIFPLTYEIPLARSIVNILGRVFIFVPVCFSLLYATEIYPTSVRGVATGFSLMAGGLVSSLSPFTKELGEMTAVYVPFLLFALLSLIAVGLYKVLPETKGKELVHTVDELLERKRGTTPIFTISTRL